VKLELSIASTMSRIPSAPRQFPFNSRCSRLRDLVLER